MAEPLREWAVPPPDSPVWIAGHEAAHAVAAHLLGRKIAGVSIRRDATSGGRSHIYTLRQPRDLEEALKDICIFVIADIWSGCRSLALEWAETGEAQEDEGQAFAAASKIPGVAGQEVAAIVELGRARAHVLLEREDFRACHEALLPVLLEQQVLSGEAVEAICTAATAKLSDFSASDPGDAEGAAQAHSAAREGSTGGGHLLQSPAAGVGRPSSGPEMLTGVSEGGRLAAQGSPLRR